MPLFGPPNIEKLKAKGDVAGLLKAVRESDPAVRSAAVRALGELVAPDAIDPLTLIGLTDESDEVRAAARNSLRAFGVLSVMAVMQMWSRARLGSALLSEGPALDRETPLGRQSESLLRELGAVDLLAAELEHPTDPESRWVFAASLGTLGDRRAVEPLLRALKYKGMRSGAARALKEILGPEAERVIAEGRQAPDVPVVEPEQASSGASDIPARWPPAPSGTCDICSDPIEPEGSHLVPAPEFRHIVNKGYNPFTTGRAPARLAQALGFDSGHAYEGWNGLASQEAGDWGLCGPCAEDVAAFVLRGRLD
jgi:hypothetical protein